MFVASTGARAGLTVLRCAHGSRSRRTGPICAHCEQRNARNLTRSTREVCRYRSPESRSTFGGTEATLMRLSRRGSFNRETAQCDVHWQSVARRQRSSRRQPCLRQPPRKPGVIESTARTLSPTIDLTPSIDPAYSPTPTGLITGLTLIPMRTGRTATARMRTHTATVHCVPTLMVVLALVYGWVGAGAGGSWPPSNDLKVSRSAPARRSCPLGSGEQVGRKLSWSARRPMARSHIGSLAAHAAIACLPFLISEILFRKP
jgi:hypothetical protein